MKFNIKKSGAMAAGAIIGYSVAGKASDLLPSSIDDKIKGAAFLAIGLLMPSMLSVKGMDDLILGAGAGMAVAGVKTLVVTIDPVIASTIGISGVDQSMSSIGGFVYNAADRYTEREMPGMQNYSGTSMG